MDARKAFTDEEWRTLTFAPLWILSQIGSADGRVDQAEWATLIDLAEKGAQPPEGAIHEVLQEVSKNLKQLTADHDADPRNPISGLRQVGRILDQRIPDQANAFKNTLLDIAAAVAEASGGSLTRAVTPGAGAASWSAGSRTSVLERHAIEAAARALGLLPDSHPLPASAEYFTVDEEKLLLNAPFWTAIYVAGADSKVDYKEWQAVRQAVKLAQSDQETVASSIFKTLEDRFDEAETAFMSETRAAHEGLSQVAQVLDRRLDVSDALLFKDGLLSVGRTVAEASGGRFGIGSRTSDEERQALQDLAGILGMRQPSLSAALTTFGSIVVPLDGSMEAEIALGPALNIAERFGSKVTLIRVVSSNWMHAAMVSAEGTPAVNPAALEDIRRETYAAADSYLNYIRTNGNVQNCTTVVAEGDPVSAILEQAEDAKADLIVVATSGSKGLKRVFEGKVTEDIVRRSKTPVLVVRAEETF